MGYAYLYTFTQSQKKLKSSSVRATLVEIHSEELLFRLYEPTAQLTFIFRRRNFKTWRSDHLSAISTLLNFVSLHYERELSERNYSYDEEGIFQLFQYESVLPVFQLAWNQRLKICHPNRFYTHTRKKSGRRYQPQIQGSQVPQHLFLCQGTSEMKFLPFILVLWTQSARTKRK